MTPAERAAALAQASMPTLLMSLAQITGDRRWLQEPFLPRRDISIFAEPSGGLSAAAREAIIAATGQVLDELASGARVLPPPLGEDAMVEMMSVCLGERVPAEYATMAREEMGFADRRLDWRAPPAPDRLAAFRVLVVGAGFSGLCAAYRLGQMGIACEVLEKNTDLGGTWFENDYPEAGVDTPNHFYSFSFAPNLGWSSNYSKRGEVWEYQRRVAHDLDLRRHIAFGVEVTAMRWHEDRQQWEISSREADGSLRTRWAHAVVTAVGQLNRPKLGSIRGLDTFTGTSWHSAQWRHDVSLEDREVAVIGTGASAMQFLRTVAGRARKVTVFQRSPQWARPPQDYHGSVSPESRWLLENVPYYYAWYRFGLMWRFGDGLLPTVRRDPAWPHPQRSMNYRNDRQREQLTEYLLGQLDGRPDLIAKCLPDYPPYGKRILIDNGWYEALRRPNVELVTEAVDHVDGADVVDAAGVRHRADVIVLATGFEPGKMLWPMDIRGRSGVPLKDVWGEDDPKAHLGLTVPDYPNLFVLTGPNTGLAHGGSLIFVTECQVRYVSAMLREMLEKNLGEVEVRRAVHDDYNARVDAEHADLVWTHPGMRNWYRNDRGRVFSPMPWRLVDYWRMTHQPDLAEYEVQAARV
ncbi:MAG: NAD(P)-binding domain-containing protein [Burkholderiales bacterium]|nr:NAD(P)-binding domain-containing protein [Burkholderiales bacterium]